MDSVQQSNSTSTQRAKKVRRYAFACIQCRQKKIKCGGEQPSCRKCQRAQDSCQYPQRATDTSLAEAQSRIVELEAELARVRQTLSPESSPGAGDPSTCAENDFGRQSGDPGYDDLSPHIGVDENGVVTYHGPTSRFHAASIADFAPATPNSSLPSSAQGASSNDLLNTVWELFLDAKTELELGARPALVRKLLNIYWTWQHPLHHYVHKPCFVMDMALGGPYYSKFLLHAMCSLAARHLELGSLEHDESNKGETFLASARELLVKELAAPKPRIPTIQGLLVLGGRQCAVGKSSEGWIYTGMAIRMMTDLGLHLNLHRLAELEKLTAIDLELRKRLYCSAYIWDKSLSLSLGRPPTLVKPPEHLDTLDMSGDDDLWAPAEYPDYPLTKIYTTLCLQHFCRLGQVIELIMRPVHGNMVVSALRERLSNLEEKLFSWYENLPHELKMTDASEVCPPPHILSLNLLYHTLHIIVWRPYRHVQQLSPHATEVCLAKAEIVHRIFLLYGKSFEWKKMTYLISYCVYTAATIDVEETKSANKESREPAARRLAVSLKILESEAKQTPGIRRSIDIIKRQLRSWNPGAHDHRTRCQQSESAQQATQDHTAPRLAHTVDKQGQGYVRIDGNSYTSPTRNSGISTWPLTADSLPAVGLYESFDFGDTGAGFQPEAFSWPNAWNLDVDLMRSSFDEPANLF